MPVAQVFELSDGTSEKFWEITTDGVEVTVRYGRIGAAGQTKVKAFDSEPAAAAHAAKLVAEKTRKGYVHKGGAGQPSPPAAPAAAGTPKAVATEPPGPGTDTLAVPDEDAWVLPGRWYPRRGSVGFAPLPPNPAAAAAARELIAGCEPHLTKSLRHRSSDPEARAEAEIYLADPARATPLGAAAVLAVANGVAAASGLGEARRPVFAEAWLAERGVVFAAKATVELMSLTCNGVSHTVEGPVAQPLERSKYQTAADGLILRIAGLVRTALATAGDREYQEAVEALAGCRGQDARRRVATSFLVPTRTDWVDADCAGAPAAPWGVQRIQVPFLLGAISTPDQLAVLADVVKSDLRNMPPSIVTTLADGLGAAAAPLLLDLFAQSWSDTEHRRRWYALIAALPCDEAFQALVDRLGQPQVQQALAAAASRFPVRAMRLLAAAGPTRGVAPLLRAHVIAHPEAVGRALPALPAAVANQLNSIVEEVATLTDTSADAPDEALPELLRNPPWLGERSAGEPLVIPGLQCTDEPAIDWLPGEQESLLRSRNFGTPGWRDRGDWPSRAAGFRAGTLGWNQDIAFVLDAPEDLARSCLPGWQPNDPHSATGWLGTVAARFGLDAYPVVLGVARQAPSATGPVVLPYSGPEFAVLAADWLARLKSMRPVAQAWLARHPETAARALVPVALGRAGVGRRQAEQALRWLAGAGHRAVVRTAAAGYGEAAGSAINGLASEDPVALLPARLPVLPDWADPAGLPRVALRDGSGSLPHDAARHLMMVLALSRLGEPYAGVAVVREACEPESLAWFVWSLFEAWRWADYPASEKWVLDGLGLLGDDEVVRLLTPYIREWPGQAAHARAVTGLDVLAAIGTDVALTYLNGIAQKAKFRGLKEKANEKVAEIAAGLGLSAEQLADRLVPDFGLDADGSLLLDYGPRRFRVGFDEQLRPWVADEAGKRLKALPKPGTKDDPDLAPAAAARFAGLKKDVRTIAADQLRRLEQAMVTRRRWTAGEFTRLIVGHPLVWHIARRLVWTSYAPDGSPAGALRVAEDRSLADVSDHPVDLGEDTTMGIAHPLDLGDDLAAWAEMFADYEILQPFAQLGRDVHLLTEAERAEGGLTRFDGSTVPVGRLLGLERRGWRRGEPQDAGVQEWIERDLPGDRTAVIGIRPGIAVGLIGEFPDQTLERCWLQNRHDNAWWGKGTVRLDDLDPVLVSELIRDLESVVG